DSGTIVSPNGITAVRARTGKSASIGARAKRSLSAFGGMKSSFVKNFRPSAAVWSSPARRSSSLPILRLARFGPIRSCDLGRTRGALGLERLLGVLPEALAVHVRPGMLRPGRRRKDDVRRVGERALVRGDDDEGADHPERGRVLRIVPRRDAAERDDVRDSA